MPNYVLSCTDVQKDRVVMTKACFDRHKDKRPELRNPQFFPAQIIRALQHPKFTIRGKVPGTECYYLEEYSKGDIVRYTKVIIDISHRRDKENPICYICTVFRPDTIKELAYGYKPKYY